MRFFLVDEREKERTRTRSVRINSFVRHRRFLCPLASSQVNASTCGRTVARTRAEPLHTSTARYHHRGHLFDRKLPLEVEKSSGDAHHHTKANKELEHEVNAGNRPSLILIVGALL